MSASLRLPRITLGIAAVILVAFGPSLASADDAPAPESSDQSKSSTRGAKSAEWWNAEGSTSKVDSFGTFSESIAIDVPEFHGITPDLALTYRSSGGNGLVGVGWSLGGASRIDRASPGKGTPRYDASDIYLLDGEELIPCASGSPSPSCTTGGTHSTKTESYVRITLSGSGTSAKWTITAKDGTRSVYGAIRNAAGADGSSGTSDDQIFTWGLKQVIDTKSNLVTYTWGANQFGGTWSYLDSVSYNGAAIKLHYEARSDIESAAMGGGQRERVTGRLKSIDVNVGSSRVRAYKLSYTTGGGTGRSLLASVQQFGKNATLDASGTVTGGTSLPAITAGYPTTTSTTFTAGTWDKAMGWGGDRRFLTLDVNGDGKSDMLEIAKSCFLSCSYVGAAWISDGLTFARGTSLTLPSYDDLDQFHVMDINGDGDDDFIALTKSGTKWKRSVFLSNGTSGFTAGATDTAMSYETYEKEDVVHVASHFLPADVDGDGKTDLIEVMPRVACPLFCGKDYTRVVWRSTGTGFTQASSTTGMVYDTSSRFYPGDFNGDGKTDFVELEPSGINTLQRRVWLSDGTSFTAGAADTSTHSGPMRTLAIDVNGDGKTDLVELLPEFLVTRRKVWISTGSSFVQTSSVQLGFAMGETTRFVEGDVNGDGKSDYIMVTGGMGATRTVYRSTGEDFVAGASDSLGIQSGHQYLGGDIDGDGLADMIELYSVNLGTLTARQPWLASGAYPDLLTSLGTGLGGKTTVSYAPSTTWVNTNNPPIVQTANKVTAADGRGDSSTTTYRYKGGKVDAARERFLGFAYQKETRPCIASESACPYSETWFEQDYGATGNIKRIDIRDGAATLLRSHVYEHTTNGASVPWTALPTGRWSYTYVGTGAACPGAECKRRYLKRTFNAYGEVTKEVEYGDYDVTGDERTVATTFVPNTTVYIVDRPADLKVFEGTSSSGTLLNETLTYYDGATTWNQAPAAGYPTRAAHWLASAGSFVSTKKEYDAWGNATAEIDELGRRTETTFDTTFHVFPTSVTNALDQSITTSWGQTCPVPTQSTDINGQVTTFAYDSLCRLVQKSGPGGKFENHSYVGFGTAGSQYEQIDEPAADGTTAPRWKRRYFDGLDRDWRVVTKGPDVSTGDIYVDTTFNARGKEAARTASYYFASGTPTTYATTLGYDALDRPIRTTYPGGAYTTTAYGLWSTTSTDELGRSTTDRFDAFGNRVAHVEVIGGASKTTTFEYDARQNLEKTTDPAGNVTTTQTTDSLGRVTQQVDIDRGTTTYEYDGAGRLLATTDAKEQRTTFAYDALDRKTSKTSRAGTSQAVTVSWAYDQPRAGYFNVGLLTKTTDAEGTKTLDYDVLGRVVRTIRTIDGLSYTIQQGFDAGGRVLWTTYPDGDTVGTAAAPLLYDSAGRIKSIPGYVSSAKYDPDGDVIKITNANGSVTTRSYSAQRGWLDGITTTAGSATVQKLAYTRNAKGLVTAVTSPIANESWSYVYDELDRLKTATNTSSSTYSQTLGYDAIGNITSSSALGAYTYHATRKHAVTAAGTNTYAYDAAGHMTSGGGRTFTWTGDNQLASVTVGGIKSTMTYDADGNRIQQVEGASTHIYLGDDYEITGDWTTKYVSLGDVPVAMKDGTTKLWIHTDQLGSIQAETNASGVEVLRKKYRPYGDILTASGSQDDPRGYTAQRHDGSGLVYLHARYYDPELGRFISPDDVIDGPNTVGLNRYTYTANNPINNTDVSGHNCNRAGFKGRSGSVCRKGSYKAPSDLPMLKNLGKALFVGGAAVVGMAGGPLVSGAAGTAALAAVGGFEGQSRPEMLGTLALSAIPIPGGAAVKGVAPSRPIALAPKLFGTVGDDVELARRAALVPTLTSDGAFNVVVHGTPNSVYVTLRKGLNVEHSPATFASWIQKQQGYKQGQAVQLNACSTGQCATGFAQQLANVLGATVHAPTHKLKILEDGFIAKPHGTWQTFGPKP